MRAVFTDKVAVSEQIHFEFEGRPLTALPGDSVAAALMSNGIVDLRVTQTGASRGIFCGMGICHDCLVAIDGQLNQRACVIKAHNGMKILRQQFLGKPLVEAPHIQNEKVSSSEIETPDLLIIGGGVGGMSAAIIAAQSGLDVMLLDERPQLGGQFSKQPAPIHASSPPSTMDKQVRMGRELIQQMTDAGVRIIKEAHIWAGFPKRDVLAIYDGRTQLFRPQRLLIATGAYERGLPVHGWTLPGVMTTGAAQSLLRTYRVVPGQRIFVAGNGPFNVQVALELAQAGAEIVGIAESAAQPSIRSITSIYKMYRSSPRLLFDGLRYLRQLKEKNIPLLYNSSLSSVCNTGEELQATITSDINRSQSEHHTSFDADIICVGYGFLPSNILLRTLGCEHHYDISRKQLIVKRSENFETTKSGIYAVGDCAGLGGAYAAHEEGGIAGLHVATSLGHKPTKKHLANRTKSKLLLNKHRRFQSGLWKLYAARVPEPKKNNQGIEICRCESVTLDQIHSAIEAGCNSIGEIKQQTRVGMGRCQGRYCAPILAELLSERTNELIDESKFFAPRVPITPVRIGDITRY